MNRQSFVFKIMSLLLLAAVVVTSGASASADGIDFAGLYGRNGPSAVDLDNIQADIKYPNYTWMYLPEYVSATVTHKAVYCFRDPDSDVWRNGNYYKVYGGTEVTILAISEGYACVILTGTRNAGWINLDYFQMNDSYTMEAKPQPEVPALILPQKPQSSYGKALRKNLIDGIYFSERDKANVVTETYYSRHVADGSRQPWYTSSSRDDHGTGYRINYYYADGVLFFADAYIPGHRSSVTFYFWGNQLFACHDLRIRNSRMSFIGEADYNRMVAEFGDIQELSASQKSCYADN